MAISRPSHTRRSNTSDSWITPKWLIERLGHFDLDPCQCDPQPWPCAAAGFTETQNGLSQGWFGFVWCNPPYGRSLGKWLQRMAAHNHGVALIFARTDTKAFFQWVWPHATAVLFIEGRLTFSYPDGTSPPRGHNSGGPSVLISYGTEAVNRLRNVQDLGKLIVLGENSLPVEAI